VYGPVIEGSRFRLRPPRPEDAPLMVAWLEDVEVTARLMIRFPPSLDEEEEWLRQRARDRDALAWAIEHEGRLVGVTGFDQIDWRNLHATSGTVIGDKRVWGRGIGGEVMRLRADFAFTELPLRKLKSAYLEGNEASRRAQRGAGYREVGRLRQEVYRQGRWLDLILTELLREEWEAGRRGQAQSRPSPGP